MLLTRNVHYLKLRKQKNMKNIVEVLGVVRSDSGVTVESLKSKKKLKPKKSFPYFEFSFLTECTKLVTYLLFMIIKTFCRLQELRIFITKILWQKLIQKASLKS